LPKTEEFIAASSKRFDGWHFSESTSTRLLHFQLHFQ